MFGFDKHIVQMSWKKNTNKTIRMLHVEKQVFLLFRLCSTTQHHPTPPNTTLPSWLIVSSTHVDVEPRPRGEFCGSERFFFAKTNGVDQAERSFSWVIFFVFLLIVDFVWSKVTFFFLCNLYNIILANIVFITKFVSFL